MNEKIYIRFDVDNVGENIELNLLNKHYNKAQDIHDCIQLNMRETLKELRNFSSLSLLMIGCDDILFSINKIEFDLDFFDNLKEQFYTKTGFTISIGIGNSMLEALFNLRVAKLSGKNKIITEFN
jgi:hypothetical protein